MSRRAHIVVTVKEDFDKKYRQFRKKLEREKILRDAKKMIYFESDSQKNRKRRMREIKMEVTRRALQELL